VPIPYRRQGRPRMQLKSILQRVARHKSFVYGTPHRVKDALRLSIEVPIRDALVEHDLLIIHPRRPRGRVESRRPPSDSASQRTRAAGTPAQSSAVPQKVRAASVHAHRSAGTIGATQRELAPPTVGGAADLRQRVLALVRYLFRGGPFLR
jgi:hypothetical protein